MSSQWHTGFPCAAEITSVQDVMRKGEKIMKHFHVNHNMPGYLPEAEGVTTETWEDAQMALREELTEQQEIFADNCANEHETPEELENCLSGGEFRCDWQELVAEVQADIQTNATPHNFTVTYSTPSGPDVAVFVRECHETDCKMTWED